jgi:hypothetical protein
VVRWERSRSALVAAVVVAAIDLVVEVARIV